ncbi:hypothetical protein HCJ76_26585 [Streptomyces sp. MC1]|uniref:hypothetical protein n=1 Tax=unclassified Streptomyces TaxID=2593676 RepID=UPI0004C5CFB2|nr:MULTISPECIES: hypothetical protein [unclassified Streptomyces]MBG7701558.1 hypothetical protein [Streptomyces sp. MC1]
MNSISPGDVTLRGLGACCALGNVVLHGLLVPDHLEEKFYVGLLFALGSAVMLIVAAALVTSRRPMAAWFTGALVSLGMIVGFLLSRTVGLPDGYHEPGWEPPYGPLSLIVEGLFVLAFLTWIGRSQTTAVAPAPPHKADLRRTRRRTPAGRAARGDGPGGETAHGRRRADVRG